MRQRFANAMYARPQNFAIGNTMKFQRRIFREDTGKRDSRTALRQGPQKQDGIGFIAMRVITGDDHSGRDFQETGMGGDGRGKFVRSQARAAAPGQVSAVCFRGQGGRYRVRRWCVDPHGPALQVGTVCLRPRSQTGTAPDE